MAGYIGTQAVSVNTTSATISDDLTVGDNVSLTSDSAVLNIGAGNDLKITHDGTNGDFESAGNLTFDVAGDIILDADGGDVNFKDAGTEYLRVTNGASGPEIFSTSNDGDLFLKGVDGGATITALKLDMSAAGQATFNSGITTGGGTTTFKCATNDNVRISQQTHASISAVNDAVDAFVDLKLDGSTVTINAQSNGSTVVANGLTLTNGNITIAADHGIAFGNASGGTKTIVSNLLDDYEEGTFTPAVAVDSGSVGSITASGRYTKIGNSVTVTFSVQIGSASNALLNTFTGFPFTPSNITAAAVGAIRENGNTGDMWHIRATPNSTAFLVRLYDNSQGVVAGDTFLGSVTYLTNT